MSFALTNSLTERCDIVASEESEDPELPSLVVHLRNNLFRNGTLSLADYLQTGAWSVRDNLFDTMALTGLGVANSHNGYISTPVLPGSGGGDKTIAPPADYQDGPLGPYYYPSSGTKLAQLIDAGSRSARAAGLCRYTTLPSQVQEANTRVDIGLHYAPVERVAAIPKASMTATASSEQEGYPSANVLDNSIYDPGWVGTETSPQWGWLRLDLGSSRSVRRLDYQPPEWDSQFETTRQYEVYVTDSVSNDPSNWGVPLVLGTWHWPTHLPNGPDTKTVEFTGSGRYVIMRLQSAWYPSAANELWVYRAHPEGTTLMPADTDQDNLPDYLEGCCAELDVSPALGLTVRIDDSAEPECSGRNPNPQDRTVVTNLCVPDGMMFTLAVTVEGKVETENLQMDQVFLNGMLLFESTREGGGCEMETKTAIALVSLSPCNPTIRLRYNTRDEKWHKGAYARILGVQVVGSQVFLGSCTRTHAEPCEW